MNAFLDGLRQQNFLFNSAFDTVDRLGEQLDRTILRPSEYGRDITANNLDTYNNLYDIADRKQNFGTDLATSRLTSQENRRKAQYSLDTFDERSRIEDLNRQLQLRQNQYSLDTFDEKARIEDLNREIKLRQNQFQLDTLNLDESISRIEKENQLEQLTFDKAYNQFQQSIGDPTTMSRSEYFDRAYSRIREGGVHPNVKARVDSQLRDSFKDQQQYIDKIVEQVAKAQAIPSLPEDRRESVRQSVILGISTASARLDADLIRTAIANGVIREEDLPPIVVRILNQGQNQQTPTNQNTSDIVPTNPQEQLPVVEQNTNDIGQQIVDEVAPQEVVQSELSPQEVLDQRVTGGTTPVVTSDQARDQILSSQPVETADPQPQDLASRVESQKQIAEQQKVDSQRSEAIENVMSTLTDPEFAARVSGMADFSKDLTDQNRYRILPSGLFDGLITPENAEEKVNGLQLMLDDLFVPHDQKHPYMQQLVLQLMDSGNYSEEEAVAELGKIITSRLDKANNYVGATISESPYVNPFEAEDSPLNLEQISRIESLYNTEGVLSESNITPENVDEISENLVELKDSILQDSSLNSETKEEMIRIIQMRGQALIDYQINNPQIFQE